MLFDANNGIANVYERDEVHALKRDSTWRFWNNVTLAFLLHKFEKKYWESTRKAIKKQNREAFVTSFNTPN
jgi:hypothetical protein